MNIYFNPELDAFGKRIVKVLFVVVLIVGILSLSVMIVGILGYL